MYVCMYDMGLCIEEEIERTGIGIGMGRKKKRKKQGGEGKNTKVQIHKVHTHLERRFILSSRKKPR